MNLFKQLLLAGLFLSSMYCGIISLWLGEYVGAVIFAVIALVIFLKVRAIIKQLLAEKLNCDIHNKTAE